MEDNLNTNDKKLLSFCEEWKFIGEIARSLNIAPKNVSVRVDKLEKKNLILVKRAGRGKKTKVRTKSSIKYQEYTIAVLEHIKKKGGIYEEELDSLIDDKKFNSSMPHIKEYDRRIAKWIIKHGERPMVKSKFFINSQGETFIKVFEEERKEALEKLKKQLK